MSRSSNDVPVEVWIDPIELGHNIDGCCPNAARRSQNGYVLADAVVLGRGSVLVQNSFQRVRWRDPYLRNPGVGVYLSVLFPRFVINTGGLRSLGNLSQPTLSHCSFGHKNDH